MRNYWLIREGEGNKYAKNAIHENCIALGWPELNLDLSSFSKLEKKEFVGKVSPLIREASPGRTDKYYDGSARQLHKFLSLVQPDDVVLMPFDKSASFKIGLVKSGYYNSERDPNFPYRHRRNIQWLKTAEKSVFSEKLKNSSGSIMTIFGGIGDSS